MNVDGIRRYSLGADAYCMTPVARGEWMRAEEVHAVFAPGVAYMPVPRCDRCDHWRPTRSDLSTCELDEVAIMTDADFGCVRFKAKA